MCTIVHKQAPIPSRREAEEICQKLLVKGFECYVAETAMFDASSVGTKQASKKAPTPPPVAAPKPTTQVQPPKALPPVLPKNQTTEVDMMETDEIREMFSPNTAANAPEARKQPQKVVLPKPQKITPPKMEKMERAIAEAPVTKPAPIKYAPPQPVAQPKSKIMLPKPVGSPFEVGESTHAKTAKQKMAKKAPSPQTTIIQGEVNEKARVRVAEAVPVPLAKVEKQTSAFEQERKHTFRGYPSQYFNQSSLWAEMSHFSSQNAALSYWRTVMSRDSAIPHGLRLRVIKPLRKYAAKNKLSLRVGPFKTTRAIRRLCSLTQPEKIRCRAVKDLGTSITMSKKRQRLTPDQLRERRKRNVKVFTNPTPTSGDAMYYLHLGSFRTSELAMRKWQDLSARHKVLSGLNEYVASPNYSSAARQRFRLRAGPFARSMGCSKCM